MSNDPNARPPFRQHPYYYPAIKIVVLLVAVTLLHGFWGICEPGCGTEA